MRRKREGRHTAPPGSSSPPGKGKDDLVPIFNVPAMWRKGPVTIAGITFPGGLLERAARWLERLPEPLLSYLVFIKIFGHDWSILLDEHTMPVDEGMRRSNGHQK